MPRVAISIAVVSVLLLVASEFAVPAYLEGRAEGELTERGGTAQVNLEALPALRLLGGGGRRLEATGTGLELAPEEDQPVLESLDSFDEIDVRLDNVRAGPLRDTDVALTRADGADTYTLEVEGTVSGQDLADFAADEAGGVLGGLIRQLASGGLPFDGLAVPVTFDTELESDGGRARAVGGGGSVAGIPAGPLAEVVAEAVAARL